VAGGAGGGTVAGVAVCQTLAAGGAGERVAEVAGETCARDVAGIAAEGTGCTAGAVVAELAGCADRAAAAGQTGARTGCARGAGQVVVVGAGETGGRTAAVGAGTHTGRTLCAVPVVATTAHLASSGRETVKAVRKTGRTSALGQPVARSTGLAGPVAVARHTGAGAVAAGR
jgi:hypothetical protein